MNRVIFALPLVIFVMFVGYMMIGLERNPHYRPSTLMNRTVPTFHLAPLFENEQGFSSNDLIGQPSLVNFFASWCGPCRLEHPLLFHLADRFAIRIYSINYRDNLEDARTWLNQLGNPYHRIGIDTDGRTAIEWGVSGIPETFIVDHQGRIRYKHIGPIQASDIEETIGPLLREVTHSVQND